MNYDSAGRVVTRAITSSVPGTPVPETRSVYDLASGKAVRTQSVVAGVATAEIVRTYDTLGRITSYTDADGNTSTTTYDLLGRTATTNDGKATRTYVYDGGTERRGLLTGVTDSHAGNFTATYDAAGEVRQENWPNGFIVNRHSDAAGRAIGIEYSDGTSMLYANYVGRDVDGSARWGTDTFSNSGYSYDATERLVESVQETSAGCTKRSYSFDQASNRTTMTTRAPNEAGDCTDVTTARTWAFDTADRVTGAGYTYDDLGRTLSIPAVDTTNGGNPVTVTYHATDLVDTIAHNGVTTDYAIDVTGERIRSWTDTSSGAAKAVNHYDDDDDNPSWTAESAGHYSRPLAGINGLAGIYDSSRETVDYQISNLHGDIVAIAQPGTVGFTSTFVTDEYGVPAADSAASGRYGWLGAKQRAADRESGIIIMGVRLYNTATGRFLQTDPVSGGSCNRYEYACASPIDNFDLDGKRCYRWASRLCRKARGYYNRARVYGRWAWKNSECRYVRCVHGTPHHYRTVRRGGARYQNWYCSRGARTRSYFGIGGFVAGLSVAGLPVAAHIAGMEVWCAHR